MGGGFDVETPQNTGDEPQLTPVSLEASGEQLAESYQCLSCAKAFLSDRGLKEHVSRAHPEVANDAIRVARAKARWNNEEVQLLATAEAEAVVAGVKFLNPHLEELFPERTLEAIKGRRRSPAYRNMVQGELQRLSEVATAEDVREEPVAQRTVEEDPKASVRSHLISLLGDFDENKGFQGAGLKRIAHATIEGQDTTDQVYAWLSDLFPAPPARAYKRKERKPERGQSRRWKRRSLYGRVQALYRKSISEAARVVLEGEVEAKPENVAEFTDYWSDLFGQPSAEAPVHRLVKPRSLPDDGTLGSLWAPVLRKEVETQKLKIKSAAGPDLIKPSDWNSVPTIIKAIVFNIFILNQRVHPEMSKTRTVFIPKKNLACLPSDFRPISVGSVVVRHFHRILAYRLQKLPIHDSRQTAFMPGDGMAGNLYLLQTLLAESRQRCRSIHVGSVDLSKAFDTLSHNALMRILSEFNLPSGFIGYVGELYRGATTTLQLNGRDLREVAIGRSKAGGSTVPALVQHGHELCSEQVAPGGWLQRGWDLFNWSSCVCR